MNAKSQSYTKYIKLLLYIVVIALINLAGITLFFRADLTDNRIYSLSDVSRKVVATLTEPMTVKVFFTKNLPAPHNNTELYLRDLLNEYALYNRKQFRVQFYDVSPESEGISETARLNRETAREYGIDPVQIQVVEKDEIKFTQAYMGLVLIHGDIIERIPTIISTDGLEYRLTSAIQKLNNKVSALLALDGKVAVKLYLSSSIYQVAPYMNIKGLDKYAEQVGQVIKAMNARTYGKLAFEHIDPTPASTPSAELEKLNVMQVNWPAIPEARIQAGNGAIGLVLQHQSDTRTIPLLSVLNLPLLGTQYQMTQVEALEELIGTNLDRMININQELGYLSGFGTLDLYGGNFGMGPADPEALNQFNQLVGKTYDLKPIDLKTGSIPEGLKSLVIARPTEQMDDYTLYQIDQALMHGTNLIVFADAFKEIQPPPGQPMLGNQPFFVPTETGLEKLLEHYGVRVKKAIVLDEKCYKQPLPRSQGGGEQPIYFAPIIQSEHMNKKLDWIKNIKALVTLKASPLELDAERIEAGNITAHELFASSERSWEMRDRIMLDPRMIPKPGPETEMQSLPIAYLLEGSFSSYFKGRPIPAKTEEKNSVTDEEDITAEAETRKTAEAPKPAADPKAPQITATGAMTEQSPKVRIAVVGCSEMLKDSLLDNEGETTNALFVLNTLDALNDREEVAVMHSKIQQFNPLAESSPGVKTMVKSVNMVGLPVLVVLCGILVWWRRHARRRRIESMFRA